MAKLRKIALGLLNRLPVLLRKAGMRNFGSHLSFYYFASGSQYIDKVDHFYGDKYQKQDTSPDTPVKDTPLPRELSISDLIRKSIALLMEERAGDEPLFNLQGHWQAVYRILVDKGYCRDSDFDGFDAFIRTVMPEKVNKPYKKDSVKNINKTDFNKPFDRWQYDPSISGTRKPFERMQVVAQRFKEILEENVA